jgi:hypothetical protein
MPNNKFHFTTHYVPSCDSPRKGWIVLRQLEAIGIKFVLTALFLYLVLGLVAGESAMAVFWTSVVVTLVNYSLIDVIVLPSAGRATALVCDFVISYLVVWITGRMLFHQFIHLDLSALLASLAITAMEGILFDRYLHKRLK